MEAIQAMGEGENPANFYCTAESTIDKDLTYDYELKVCMRL